MGKGFAVYLVNAAHVRNVSGRKTDMSDAAWLQQLHTCGLLQSSYLPDGVQESLRNLVRYRKTLTEESSRFVLRMEKALEMMNVKLHMMISDLTGKTGMAIVQAIIGGERDAKNSFPSSMEGSRHLLKPSKNPCKGIGGKINCSYWGRRIASCDGAIEKQLQQ